MMTYQDTDNECCRLPCFQGWLGLSGLELIRANRKIEGPQYTRKYLDRKVKTIFKIVIRWYVIITYYRSQRGIWRVL